MKSKLTYAQRNKLLIPAVLIMLWVSWTFGFKKTAEAISACNDLEEKAQINGNLPNMQEAMKKDLILLESKIGNDADTTGFQQRMLKTISNFCDSSGLMMREYPGAEEKTESGYKVETHQFTIQGNFHALVRLIHHLEMSKGIGKLAGADFRKVKLQGSKREELCLFLYINHTLKRS